MNVFVIGNGKVESIEIIKEYSGKSDLVICADGGAKYLYQAGIRPHILVGDFDSIDPALRKFYHDTGTEIIKFPRHKDYTDMELALDIALQRVRPGSILPVPLVQGWITPFQTSSCFTNLRM